jgi:hypothetical protein
LIDARDGTVLRHAPDRRGVGFAAVYVLAAPALAAGAFGLPAAVRWPLAGICALVAAITAATLVRRAARTELTAAGLVLRSPPRRARRYAWGDVEAFEPVDPGGDPDAGARAGRRVRMRLRGGEAVLLPGVAGREADRIAAALSARIGR